MAGPVFALRELRTTLKSTILIFKILVKPLDFVVKHYISVIYLRTVKIINIIIIITIIVLKFTIFQNIVTFSFENWAKVRLL